MNLEELRSQIKELDEEISTKSKELEELRAFRASIGGSGIRAPISDGGATDTGSPSAIVEPSAPDPRKDWTPEQAELLKREEERVREHARFNHHMPRPSVNIQRNTVNLPPGVSPASVLPPEMQEFLTK